MLLELYHLFTFAFNMQTKTNACRFLLQRYAVFYQNFKTKRHSKHPQLVFADL